MLNPSLGRLLIVDDETKLMAVLCELLTKHGYDAVGFTSGKEALEDLKRPEFRSVAHRPDDAGNGWRVHQSELYRFLKVGESK